MSAVANSGQAIRQLDADTQPDQVVTAKDVGDDSVLARLVSGLLRDVAKLRRRWAPDFIDFRDIAVDATGTTTFRFPHRFGAAVNYWPVKWVGSAAPCLVFNASSDGNTLVLTSRAAGTVTLRVERAG